jgi:hypothetical protein
MSLQLPKVFLSSLHVFFYTFLLHTYILQSRHTVTNPFKIEKWFQYLELVYFSPTLQNFLQIFLYTYLIAIDEHLGHFWYFKITKS